MLFCDFHSFETLFTFFCVWQKIKSGTTLDDSIGTGDQYSVDVLLKCASASASAAASSAAGGKFNKPTPCLPGQDGEFQVCKGQFCHKKFRKYFHKLDTWSLLPTQFEYFCQIFV